MVASIIVITHSTQDLNNLICIRVNSDAGITVDKSAWSNVTGFAAACFGFTLNYHTLYLLPLSVIKHGGLAFLIIYCIMLLLLGTPLLLHEMLLGQFSSLSSVHIYYNLCPLMAGLGVAMYVTVLIRAVLNISVIVWVSRSLYDIFTLFDADSGIKSIKDVAKLQTETPSVDGLFSLEYSELITLGVVIILLFLLGLTGVAGMGRISQLCVAASLLLVITLTIRCCLASDGGQAVSELLKPDWSHLTQPLTWVEASTQVGWLIGSLSTPTIFWRIKKMFFNLKLGTFKMLLVLAPSGSTRKFTII